MNLNDLARKCCENSLRRGKVTKDTKKKDFVTDAIREIIEFDRATPWNSEKKQNLIDDLEKSKTDAQFQLRFEESLKNYEPNEICDVICTLLTYSHIKGYDIEKYMDLTVKYNEIRK